MPRGRRGARRWARAGVALLLGGGAGAGLVLWRRSRAARGAQARGAGGGGERDRWARPGMSVTFRAELMPERGPADRTYTVAELLPSGRVLLEGVGGEHAENEFEAAR
jgi:hypothetical protein